MKNLRKILSSEGILKSSAAAWKYEPVVGQSYTIGYRGHRWISKFVGWTIEGGTPYMNWEDEKPGETSPPWQAYIFEGRVVVGSSADPLLVLSKA